MAHRYYSVKDAATILGIEPQKVRAMCREKDLPAIKPPGTRDWRIPISDMEEILWNLEEKARSEYRENRQLQKNLAYMGQTATV